MTRATYYLFVLSGFFLWAGVCAYSKDWLPLAGFVSGLCFLRIPPTITLTKPSPYGFADSDRRASS